MGKTREPTAIHCVIMGVSGVGKTSLAKALRRRLHWPYAEADDFHPKANIEKMASGHPLTDEDRWPWLRSLRDWMSNQADKGMSTIVTCSALKRSYRDVLRQAHGRVVFVELDAPKRVLRKRMAARIAKRSHFMPVSLLDSQLDTLEPLRRDEEGLRVSAARKPAALAGKVVDFLEEPHRAPRRRQRGTRAKAIVPAASAQNPKRKIR